jgi:hypothetical protein
VALPVWPADELAAGIEERGLDGARGRAEPSAGFEAEHGELSVAPHFAPAPAGAHQERGHLGLVTDEAQDDGEQRVGQLKRGVYPKNTRDKTPKRAPTDNLRGESTFRTLPIALKLG